MSQSATKETTKEAALDDRRFALRQKCRAKTLVVEYPQMGIYECDCLDISRKGLKLRMPVCMPCGSEILIHPPAGMDLRIGKARIMRQQVVDIHGTTWYECGIQFTEQAELRRHTWFLTLRIAA